MSPSHPLQTYPGTCPGARIGTSDLFNGVAYWLCMHVRKVLLSDIDKSVSSCWRYAAGFTHYTRAFAVVLHTRAISTAQVFDWYVYMAKP